MANFKQMPAKIAQSGNSLQICKKMRTCANFESGPVRRCEGFCRSRKMTIHLQNSASIQPRTSNFDLFFCSAPKWVDFLKIFFVFGTNVHFSVWKNIWIQNAFLDREIDFQSEKCISGSKTKGSRRPFRAINSNAGDVAVASCDITGEGVAAVHRSWS